jgi:hypothetical protein
MGSMERDASRLPMMQGPEDDEAACPVPRVASGRHENAHQELGVVVGGLAGHTLDSVLGGPPRGPGKVIGFGAIWHAEEAKNLPGICSSIWESSVSQTWDVFGGME